MRIAAYARPACIEQERRCGGRGGGGGGGRARPPNRGGERGIARRLGEGGGQIGLSGFAIVEDAQRAAYCRVL